VLEAHCGVKLTGHDVYLNVAGGLRINEPAADLAAAAALVSSLANAPLPNDAVYFGEVSLSGAIRPVAQTAARLKEAAKLGFARAVVPEAARAEAGAIRPVAQTAARLKEAAKLGFARAVVPEAARAEAGAEAGLALTPTAALADLVAEIAARRSETE
jgi:DNA repair protein RadA/Sms